VRASRELGDRMDTTVGPFRVEVIEGLRRLRLVLEPNEHGLAFDLTWEGAIAPVLEARHVTRQAERITIDTQRFAQTGCWSGTIEIDGEAITVTPDRWKGVRDRSWGVRPVGEPEPPGILAVAPRSWNMWNYAPMQFDDYSILYICSEDEHGRRETVDARRIWVDPARPHDDLGRPEHEHRFVPGTRVIESSVLSFPRAPEGPLQVRVTPLVVAHIGIGTGYGFEGGWRHGMYQGDLVVEGLDLDTERDKDRFFGIVDTVSRFETSDDDVGYGLHEYLFVGPFQKYGLTGMLDGAP
jgi:hypothetical protein